MHGAGGGVPVGIKHGRLYPEATETRLMIAELTSTSLRGRAVPDGL